LVPGKVTRDEFVTYYANTAPSIGDDSYLEVIIRSVWNLGTESVTVSRIRNAQNLDAQQRNVGGGGSSGDALRREYQALHEGGRLADGSGSGYGYGSGSGSGYGSGNGSRSGSARGMPRPPPVVRGQQSSSQQPPYSGGVEMDMETAMEQIAVLRREAVKCFNMKDMQRAEEAFMRMKEVLLLIYAPSHPEVIKAEQSIALVQRKLRMT
jgi:hypothetical protein